MYDIYNSWCKIYVKYLVCFVQNKVFKAVKVYIFYIYVGGELFWCSDDNVGVLFQGVFFLFYCMAVLFIVNGNGVDWCEVGQGFQLLVYLYC